MKANVILNTSILTTSFYNLIVFNILHYYYANVQFWNKYHELNVKITTQIQRGILYMGLTWNTSNVHELLYAV